MKRHIFVIPTLGGLNFYGGGVHGIFIFPMCVKESYCETNNVWYQELLRHYIDPKVGGVALTRAQGGNDKVWFHIWGMSLAHGFLGIVKHKANFIKSVNLCGEF